MIDNADIIEQTGALQKLSDADKVMLVFRVCPKFCVTTAKW